MANRRHHSGSTWWPRPRRAMPPFDAGGGILRLNVEQHVRAWEQNARASPDSACPSPEGRHAPILLGDSGWRGLAATSVIACGAPCRRQLGAAGWKLIRLQDERNRHRQPAAGSSVPGVSAGIVAWILSNRSDSGCLSRGPRNTSPVSGGPAAPSSISPWQTAHRMSKIALPRVACASV